MTLTYLFYMVEYLVDDFYVCVGTTVFNWYSYGHRLFTLQIFYLEYKFMKNLMKSNLLKARSFAHSFVYIDDLTINNPCLSC